MGILESAHLVVADAALNTGQEDTFMPQDLTVQIDPPARVVAVVIGTVLGPGIVVPPDEKQWLIQRADDVFLVIIRQIPTGDHKVDVAKFSGNVGAVDKGDNLVADREDLHRIFNWNQAGEAKGKPNKSGRVP